MTEPTDAEMMELAHEVEALGLESPEQALCEYTKRALAKWGTPPAVADEPVAWVDERAIGWLANSRSGAATITTTLGRQKSFERPMPLHATPQPTQAQAWPTKSWIDEVRGYLTAAADSSMSRNNSEQLASELLEEMPTQAQAGAVPQCYQSGTLLSTPDGGMTVHLHFGGSDGVETWFDAITDELAANGIKGGQHGAE